jgi:hypothetical protein
MGILSLLRLFMAKQDKRIRVHTACEKEIIDKYYDVLSTLFSKDVIPPQYFLQSVPAKNPYGLIIITDALNNVQGGIELYGLRPDFFDEYLAGEKTDADFRPEHCQTVDNTIADGRLYCAITIPWFRTHRGRKDTARIRDIRNALLRETVGIITKAYFRNQSVRDKLFIYAIGASDGGDALLKNDIQFDLVNEGIGRKDGCPLYCLTVQRTSLDRLLASVLDKRDSRGTPVNRDDLSGFRHKAR